MKKGSLIKSVFSSSTYTSYFWIIKKLAFYVVSMPLLLVGIHTYDTTLLFENARHEHFFVASLLLIMMGFFLSKVLQILRQLDARRHESDEKYRLLTDNSVSAVASHEIVFDKNGKAVDYIFLSVNAAFEAQTGLRAADILGRRVTEVIPDILKTPFIEIYGKVVLTGEPITFEENSEALGRYYFVSAYPLSQGRFATAFIDITERKKAEERLKNSEAFTKMLIETIPIPVFHKNLAGEYTVINKAFENLFWKKKSEILGKTVYEIEDTEYAENDDAEDIKLLEKPGTSAYNSQIQDGLGIVHDVIVQKTALTDKQGRVTGIIGSILNLTDLKRTEEELRLSELKLEKAMIKKSKAAGRT